VRVATTLTQDLETYLLSSKAAIWLTGIDRSLAFTDTLLRKILSANSRVKAVIMAGSQKPEDIVAVMKAGARGYVRQDMSGETLIKTLELIAYGELIVHPPLVLFATAERNGRAADNFDGGAPLPKISGPMPYLPSQPARALKESGDTGSVPSLSNREMHIIRLLMQGASNKTIALKLVITESTVKVHMKGILRKLRLRNRTQVAIWARDNLETKFTTTSVNGSSSILTGPAEPLSNL